MRKLIIKGTVFVIIGVILLQGLAFLANAIAPDGTTTFLRIDKRHVEELLDNRLNTEAIVVGSSHGDDIDFDQMSFTGYQLSRAWGDLFETRYYIENLVPRLPNIKVVFIPVSYFSFDWDNASVDELNVRRTQMYTILPGWRFLAGDLVIFLTGRGDKYFPIQAIVREDHWKGIVFSLLAGEFEPREIEFIAESCEFHSVEELDQISELRVTDTIELAEEVSTKRAHINQDTYDEIVKTIKYLQARDIRVIFFTPPYYETYTENYTKGDPNAIRTMKSSMEQLQKEYGVEYYDYSLDPAFISNHELFKDSDHLNLCGKKIFSEKLDSELEGEQAHQK